MNHDLTVLRPPVPGVAFTTRSAGNLSPFGGNDPAQAEANRRALSKALGIPSDWAFVRQVHGRGVARCGGGPCEEADAILTERPGRPVAVLVADCVPIALASPGIAGAVHAGWRGLCRGVVEAAVREVAAGRPAGGPAGIGEVTGWIGPCIGACCFEVGPEVPQGFAAAHPGAPDCTHVVAGRLHFDLRRAAAHALVRAGAVVGGDLEVPCTRCDERFWSHRRDGTASRQCLVTWLEEAA